MERLLKGERIYDEDRCDTASGHLGAEIIEALSVLTERENVVGLARTTEKAQHLGVEIRKGDYSDRGELEKSFRSVDAVLLVSGMDAPSKRIEQHRNVIDSAKNAGVGKIVYTSIQGPMSVTAFSPVVQSNRQTEEDVRSSDMDWVIGRNGIYIEPDIEYIETYRKKGEISNCAGKGKCGYTSRAELAFAYAHMLTEDKHNGQTYNLHGEPITQYQLVDYLNMVFGTNLIYKPITLKEYRQERVVELGEFLGNIITGIYEGIHEGKFENRSHFAEAAGRQHQSWESYFKALR